MTQNETSTGGPYYVSVVVVSCPCGMYPLEQALHRDASSAWNAAAAHVALNPDKCQPSMNRDVVPAALAP